jgi:hypothetical protein
MNLQEQIIKLVESLNFEERCLVIEELRKLKLPFNWSDTFIIKLEISC